MSENSPRLALPYIQPNQAQKHVTHNEGMRMLDALVQLSVIEADRNTPATSMQPGDAYITGSAPTLDWAGHPKELAVWDENHWRFYTPAEGWSAWDRTGGQALVFDGADWVAALTAPDEMDKLGLNTTADQTNRLAVASDATLLTHDGAGHQVKVNKAAAGDTASLLFQTGWSGRAEMGTAGSDAFEIKTSADGSTFNTALRADAATGEVTFPSGATGLAPAEFGDGPLLTRNVVVSRGLDLVTNGTGFLGNTYNYPTEFGFEAVETPNLPGAFSFSGRHLGMKENTEFLAVDPNRVYRMSCYIRQESAAGDWSAFANEDRHLQYMGLAAFDVDKNPINAPLHMRYRAGGVDSITTLTAPLTPGDTQVHLADAAGWNDSNTSDYNCGITILEYKNSAGRRYSHYSRLVEFDLFAPSGVNKTTNTVTLTNGFPASLANPDDPNGTWPVGTRLANSSSGPALKYSILPGSYLPQVDVWYSVVNYMGGIDLSGTNQSTNFPPGTAYVKVFWLPNYSHRTGGWNGHPDTGPNHRVFFSGLSVTPAPFAETQKAADGHVDFKIPTADFATGAISLVPPALSLTEV